MTVAVTRSLTVTVTRTRTVTVTGSKTVTSVLLRWTSAHTTHLPTAHSQLDGSLEKHMRFKQTQAQGLLYKYCRWLKGWGTWLLTPHLKAIFYAYSSMTLLDLLNKINILDVKWVNNSQKKAWDPQQMAWQSQKICLTVPNKLHDDALKKCPMIIRHVFWECCWDPKKHALQLISCTLQKSTDQLEDCQASFLGSSGTIFGIVTHPFCDCQDFFWDLTLIFRVKKGAKTV